MREFLIYPWQQEPPGGGITWVPSRGQCLLGPGWRLSRVETRGQLVLVSLATKTLEQIVRLLLSSTLLPVFSCALVSSDTLDTFACSISQLVVEGRLWKYV